MDRVQHRRIKRGSDVRLVSFSLPPVIVSFHGFSHGSLGSGAKTFANDGRGVKDKGEGFVEILFFRRDKTCFDIIAPSFSPLLPLLTITND